MEGGGWRHPVQVLDSLGGRSSLMRDVTMETGLSEVVLLIVLEIWLMRSSTQPADSRASASWSQHSSMVSHIWPRPCGQKRKVLIDEGLSGYVRNPLFYQRFKILDVTDKAPETIKADSENCDLE